GRLRERLRVRPPARAARRQDDRRCRALDLEEGPRDPARSERDGTGHGRPICGVCRAAVGLLPGDHRRRRGAARRGPGAGPCPCGRRDPADRELRRRLIAVYLSISPTRTRHRGDRLTLSERNTAMTSYVVLLPGDEATWDNASDEYKQEMYGYHREFARLLAE